MHFCLPFAASNIKKSSCSSFLCPTIIVVETSKFDGEPAGSYVESLINLTPKEQNQISKVRSHLSSILTKRAGQPGCLRSITNLKDVIRGSSKRHLQEKPPSCSLRSISSDDFPNPIAHEVILSNSRCKLKISGFEARIESSSGSSTFVRTFRLGTPGPGGHHFLHYNPSYRAVGATTPPRKPTAGLLSKRDVLNFGGSTISSGVSNGRVAAISSTLRDSQDVGSNGSPSVVSCH